MDNYLKETFAFVYYDLIVNNLPKKCINKMISNLIQNTTLKTIVIIFQKIIIKPYLMELEAFLPFFYRGGWRWWVGAIIVTSSLVS